MAPTPASEDFHDVTVKKVPKKQYQPPITIKVNPKKKSDTTNTTEGTNPEGDA